MIPAEMHWKENLKEIWIGLALEISGMDELIGDFKIIYFVGNFNHIIFDPTSPRKKLSLVQFQGLKTASKP